MKKVFISIPMNGRSYEEIIEDKKKAVENIKDICGTDIEVLGTYISEDAPKIVTHPEIWYLGKSIEILAEADYAYFCDNWNKYRGCIIEHQICLKYDIEILKS